jgi:hypothetical protein
MMKNIESIEKMKTNYNKNYEYIEKSQFSTGENPGYVFKTDSEGSGSTVEHNYEYITPSTKLGTVFEEKTQKDLCNFDNSKIKQKNTENYKKDMNNYRNSLLNQKKELEKNIINITNTIEQL